MSMWTEEEISVLKEAYPTATHDELKKLLPNRSIEAIQTKAKNLKLKKDKATRSKNISLARQKENSASYTQEELEIMKKIYPMHGVRGVKKALPHRTIKSIKQKAHTMGLKIKESEWKKDAEIVVKNDIYRITKVIYKRGS